MKTIVLSPETFDERERASMEAFFELGLRRYHIRKPGLDMASLERWLRSLPRAWRPFFVLHSHHELAHRLELGGCHYSEADLLCGAPALGRCRRSGRSCHELASLRASLGVWGSVLLSPIFSSLSKPSYGPSDSFSPEEASSLLRAPSEGRRATEVFALGGVTPEKLPLCAELGFDGVALLGGVWGAADPVAAFLRYWEKGGLHAA